MLVEEGGVRKEYCSLSTLLATANSPAGELWPGSPPPCPATTALVRDCLAAWSPARHFLFHEGTRTQIHFLLMVKHRLQHPTEPTATEVRLDFGSGPAQQV